MKAYPASNEKNFVEVVLTGGPGAGKSSSLAYLIDKLSDRDIRALTVPEVATMVIGGGVFDIERLAREEPRRYLEIQAQMMLMQGALRRQYQELARAFAPDPVVILYDRAEMDCRAYLKGDEFAALMEEYNLSFAQIRDSYDAVIHLVSAAVGAEQFYTTENNSARRESIEEAKEADVRTRRAWVGHPHLRIVDNSTDFERKLERVFEIVTHTLGIPEAYEIERKFLLASPPDMSHPVMREAQPIEIEQVYLKSDNPEDEIRVRRRSQDGHATYFWTRKRRLEDGTREERESLIRPREYIHLLSERDPDREPLIKTRYCFPYNSAYFELDEIKQGDETLWLLEIELIKKDDPVELPEFLKVKEEVTDKPEFSSAALARR